MRIRFLPLLAAGLLLAQLFASAGCGNSATSTPPANSGVENDKSESSDLDTGAPDSNVVTVSAESPSSESAKEPADDAPAAAAAGKKKPTNRLARETSPYLLLHAHNPVDWYPWGPEAFEKARQENKPIFLSIGYSSCYWCHVMERLVFMNSKIAEYMNENFVNIKVDREERPDVDDIYMTSLHVYLQLSGSPGGGGWPLSMFLTPDGKPIAGGTYFPPEDKGGRFGFPTIMKKIVEAWTTQNDSVLEGAETITNIVKREMRPGIVLEKPELNRELVDSIAGAMVQSHDPEFGGIDFRLDNPNAPKFPVPTKLAFLQYQAEVHGSREAEHALYHTLDAMAEGGIRDHLGGGFHRYSTDRQWLVPHFEKMLYDNAQLADVYIAAYQATKNHRYREVAEEILTYVLSDMTEPNGAFHSALDAETDAIEGLYYVWSKEEVDRLLGADAELFSKVYGLDDVSVFEHGYVLHLANSVEKVADAAGIPADDLKIRLFKARRTLLEVRRKRETPLKDDKILTSWNGLMIRALANAGIVFGKRQYLDAAEKSAEFILKSMRDEEGRLLRTWRVETAKLNAYLDDYAFLVDGLLTLHLATRDRKWLNASRHLTDDQVKMFRDAQNGGFYFTSHHHEQLLARTKNCWDSVLPSGNSVSVRNLIRLASLTGEDQYRDYAQEVLEMFAPQMKKNPRGVACMALALGEFLDNRDYRPLIDRVDPPEDKSNGPDDQPGKSNPEPNRSPTPESGKSPESSAGRSKASAGDGNQLVAGSLKPTEKLKKDRVSAEAYLSTDRLPAGGSCRIAVVLNVAPGWHINTNPAEPDFLVPTTVTLKSTRGTKLLRTSYPAGEELKVADSDAAYHVYSGKVTIIGEIEVPESAAGGLEEFELAIRYQSCNEQQCERPATIKFAAKAAVADVDQSVNVVNASVFARPAPKRTE